ncbi:MULTISPECIES: Bug family tripartite tricarboxylate transporter substrate binding protein [Mameliella]|uniref:Bug family tripartite tricarboxylate transporter substrate binding protein n=1 Tax=Mameliella TaxID=1434019 RepID=UPI0008411538|nr:MULTISPECIES: tripartite tricarboxylate transporter substrate-binding protein [Mameliella]ODM50036.1 hypothetical protein A9320_11860 [Ruegeria sp. PBVC088]MBY6121730.1 hypothetical protein [Mameliella alba]MDD9731832.1 tripartite tricarboxylate transporter substrate-binding protein [Mameliella sp. AT18]OWV40472.1 hypothetical protein CDZ95_21880 [Mameliella alba]OWV54201.1 hypothetical protein CDZ97_24705 [Mameliella alba]
MIFARLRTALAGAALMLGALPAAAQDWEPQGPVKMMIAFSAGGGADTLGRLLAEELNTRHGWEIIPENVTGKGGVTMAVALKDEPADGLSIGISVTEATAYAPQTMRSPAYTLSDFTFLSTITGTQMGIIAKSDRGWSTLSDVIAAAKSGETITVGAMSQKLADATYVLAKRNGIQFTTVMTGGGKASLNAVIADDVDIGWSAGAQTASVRAGDVVNLASAEAMPLNVSPDAPLLSAYDMPYTFGVKFLVMAPDGLPAEVRETWQVRIAEVLNDPDGKLNAFTRKVFSGPEVIQGAELDAYMQKSFDANAELLTESAE